MPIGFWHQKEPSSMNYIPEFRKAIEFKPEKLGIRWGSGFQMPEPYIEISKPKFEELLYYVDSPIQGTYNAEVHEIHSERGHWQVTFYTYWNRCIALERRFGMRVMFDRVNGYFIPIKEVEDPQPEDMGYQLTFYLVCCQHANSTAIELNEYGDVRIECLRCQLTYEYNVEDGGIYKVGS
jgi:hypothetical protein